MFSPRHFRFYSFLYLFIPFLIFLCGWVKLTFAMIAALAVLIFLYRCLRARGPEAALPQAGERGYSSWAVWALVIFLWMALSGSGGIGFQNLDYAKHNFLLHDLFQFRWPVAYQLQSRAQGAPGQEALLVYSLAYYLPPAVAAKLLGWNFGYVFTFFWTFAGFILVFYWFRKICGTSSAVALVLFLLFSGLDIFGALRLKPYWVGDWNSHLEWWADFGAYGSMTTWFFWTPQHAIPAWLVSGMMVHDLRHKKTSQDVFILLALAFFWSPLVSIGIAPIALVVLWKTRLKGAASFQNIFCALFVLLISALFFMANLSISNPVSSGSGFLFSVYPALKAPKLLFFCLLEFGLYSIFLLPVYRKEPLLLAAVFGLSLTPLYKMGLYNDFMLKVCMPSLFILALYVINTVMDRRLYFSKFCFVPAALFILLLAGMVTPLHELSRALRNFNIAIPRFERGSSLAKSGIRKGGFSNSQRIRDQYLGIYKTDAQKSIFRKGKLPPAA